MTRCIRSGVAAVIMLAALSACASTSATSGASPGPSLGPSGLVSAPPLTASPSTSGSTPPSNSTGTPTSAPTSTSTPTGLTVTFTRAGGLAGGLDHVLITPDGAWTHTDRSGTRKRGQLSPSQITQLQALAHDPDFVRESKPRIKQPTCADGRTYSISVGNVAVTYTDCTRNRPAIATRIAGLLATWTLR